MTTEQALNLIDQVLANVNGTRGDHQKIVEALGVLREAIKPKDKKSTPEA